MIGFWGFLTLGLVFVGGAIASPFIVQWVQDLQEKDKSLRQNRNLVQCGNCHNLVSSSTLSHMTDWRKFCKVNVDFDKVANLPLDPKFKQHLLLFEKLLGSMYTGKIPPFKESVEIPLFFAEPTDTKPYYRVKCVMTVTSFYSCPTNLSVEKNPMMSEMNFDLFEWSSVSGTFPAYTHQYDLGTWALYNRDSPLNLQSSNDYNRYQQDFLTVILPASLTIENEILGKLGCLTNLVPLTPRGELCEFDMYQLLNHKVFVSPVIGNTNDSFETCVSKFISGLQQIKLMLKPGFSLALLLDKQTKELKNLCIINAIRQIMNADSIIIIFWYEDRELVELNISQPDGVLQEYILDSYNNTNLLSCLTDKKLLCATPIAYKISRDIKLSPIKKAVYETYYNCCSLLENSNCCETTNHYTLLRRHNDYDHKIPFTRYFTGAQLLAQNGKQIKSFTFNQPDIAKPSIAYHYKLLPSMDIQITSGGFSTGCINRKDGLTLDELLEQQPLDDRLTKAPYSTVVNDIIGTFIIIGNTRVGKSSLLSPWCSIFAGSPGDISSTTYFTFNEYKEQGDSLLLVDTMGFNDTRVTNLLSKVFFKKCLSQLLRELDIRRMTHHLERVSFVVLVDFDDHENDLLALAEEYLTFAGLIEFKVKRVVVTKNPTSDDTILSLNAPNLWHKTRQVFSEVDFLPLTSNSISSIHSLRSFDDIRTKAIDDVYNFIRDKVVNKIHEEDITPNLDWFDSLGLDLPEKSSQIYLNLKKENLAKDLRKTTSLLSEDVLKKCLKSDEHPGGKDSISEVLPLFDGIDVTDQAQIDATCDRVIKELDSLFYTSKLLEEQVRSRSPSDKSNTDQQTIASLTPIQLCARRMDLELSQLDILPYAEKFLKYNEDAIEPFKNHEDALFDLIKVPILRPALDNTIVLELSQRLGVKDSELDVNSVVMFITEKLSTFEIGPKTKNDILLELLERVRDVNNDILPLSTKIYMANALSNHFIYPSCPEHPEGTIRWPHKVKANTLLKDEEFEIIAPYCRKKIPFGYAAKQLCLGEMLQTHCIHKELSRIVRTTHFMLTVKGRVVRVMAEDETPSKIREIPLLD